MNTNDFRGMELPDLPKLERQYTDCNIHGNTEATMLGNCVKCRQISTKKDNLRVGQINSGIGKIYLDANLSSVKNDQSLIAKTFMEYKGDQNIILFGKTGRGKTYLTCALLNEWLSRGKRCYFIKFYDLATISVKNDSFFNRLLTCDLLAIDEFGVAGTDYKTDRVHKIYTDALHRLYDYRVDNGLPTILITNLQPDVAREQMSDAMYSRVVYNCIKLKLEGEDLRISKE